ncbi:pyridoxamine 5'-phosphate oxidase family protein [Occallatibacter savannae]|uniref:pyridoxamine 5'-phosphate oxidase family protein n=1 Tax=Occallatibacter savannae TaxID=1002691 RepID=UPI000D685B3C|nr:pyridoxamine 5'-phosphate oxidase family protein [Occallatibacter savannae]
MRDVYARTMFSEPAKKLQERAGSRKQYERMVNSGYFENGLSEFEKEFIEARDSFYMATVTPDGWPYIQHRGGPRGFLQVVGERTLAFAEYSGNKQYISAGNLSVSDRASLFLMDYPNQARLKIIGHARLLKPGEDPYVDKWLVKEKAAKAEGVVLIDVVGFDWNCSQHITRRFTASEIQQFNP